MALPGLLVLVGVVVLASAWLAVRAYQAQGSLRQARSAVADLEQAVKTGDRARAATLLGDVQRDGQRARSATRDPVWRLASRLPLVGGPLSVATGLSTAANSLAFEVLPVTVTLTDLVRAPAGGAAPVDLAFLASAAKPLGDGSVAASTILTGLEALDDLRQPRLLSKARTDLERQVRHLASTLAGASVAAEVAPGMLGQRSPQHYFLALQNNAESRGSGGLIAAFGIVRADRGVLRLTRTGVNDELVDATTSPLKLGRDFDARYGSTSADRVWLNANESPDFPTVGRIVTSLWGLHEAPPLNGVIAIDPVAVSYLLEATGPVTLSDGTQVTAANVVDLVFRRLYDRFPTDEQTPRRTAFLKALLSTAFQQVVDGKGSRMRLAERLGRAVQEGHLQVYSSTPSVEAVLRRSTIAGALPSGAENFLKVITQNLAGGKLDYYLRREIHYTQRRSGRFVDVGGGLGIQTELAGDLTVTLRNTAPRQGLPAYVTKRADLATGEQYVPGQNRLWLSVYLGRGAQLVSATRDGQRLPVALGLEKGLTVVSTTLLLDPGQSQTFHFDVRQLVSKQDSLTYEPQPLAVPDVVRLRTR